MAKKQDPQEPIGRTFDDVMARNIDNAPNDAVRERLREIAAMRDAQPDANPAGE